MVSAAITGSGHAGSRHLVQCVCQLTTLRVRAMRLTRGSSRRERKQRQGRCSVESGVRVGGKAAFSRRLGAKRGMSHNRSKPGQSTTGARVLGCHHVMP